MKMDKVIVAGKEINAVLDNGDHYVSIKSVCDALGIRTDNQLDKLRENDDFSVRDITLTAADGKNYKTACLTAKQTTGWMYTISTTKVKPETKKFLKHFKAELESIIHQHYNEGATFNTQKFLDDPYAAMKAETEAKLKMIDQIIELKRIEKEQAETITKQEYDGSLRFRDGYMSCAAFADTLDDRTRYDTKGVSQQLGFACSKFCRENEIPVEVCYAGSHHKEVKGYPAHVIKLVWNTPFDAVDDSLFINPSIFTF